MMDALSILVLLIIGIVIVKKRLLPRLKKNGQEKSPEKEGETSMADSKQPDFRILCFNTGDFTYTDDLAHCVEYELGQVIGELKKKSCQLANDPFPIVIGSSLLIFLYYYREAATINTGEVAG